MFRVTTHLSEILEESRINPVVIFIYSNQCGSSTDLEKQLAQRIQDGVLVHPVFKVTVQIQPVLSNKIEEWFQIKHESPQIIVVSEGKVTYTEHHKAIDINKLI